MTTTVRPAAMRSSASCVARTDSSRSSYISAGTCQAHESPPVAMQSSVRLLHSGKQWSHARLLIVKMRQLGPQDCACTACVT